MDAGVDDSQEPGQQRVVRILRRLGQQGGPQHDLGPGFALAFGLVEEGFEAFDPGAPDGQALLVVLDPGQRRDVPSVARQGAAQARQRLAGPMLAIGQGDLKGLQTPLACGRTLGAATGARRGNGWVGGHGGWPVEGKG
ncbi:hypothetical protein [Caulobacter segnis]|uniref:hypothetical protein n=1 Tax=Caulobacter segnis TaxID=88688 RepID=UPI0026ECC68C|nr:hypothetical protein [Caulobacter segnis]